MLELLGQVIIAVGGGAVSGIVIVAVMYTDIAWIKGALEDHSDRLKSLERKV